MRNICIMTLTAAALLMPAALTAQGYIGYDYAPESSLRNKAGDRLGRGSMKKVESHYSLTLSARQDSTGRVTAWTAGLSAACAMLDNHGTAASVNPSDIVNGSLSVMHLRPFSRRWDIMASLGCGIYAPKDEVRLRSVMLSGALLFIYRINRNMSIGVGGGVTNSYGVPMVMPMVYFSWETRGRYELKVNMTNSMKVSAATRLGQRFKLELVAIEMEGMAAVMEMEGQSKIYSTMTMCSYICPSVQLDKRTSIYAGFGGNWLRGTQLTTRSLKGMFDSFKSQDNGENPYFNVSIRVAAGIRYGL